MLSRRANLGGFTLIEIMLTLVIVSIMALMAYSSYREYIERTEINIAIQDIRALELIINSYAFNNNGEYPASLAEVNQDGFKDPWGNSYKYTNIDNEAGKGSLRKDRNLVPINSDYDLYSAGPDGETVPPLTAKVSKDDIVRANNGGFVGKAEDY